VQKINRVYPSTKLIFEKAEAMGKTPEKA